MTPKVWTCYGCGTETDDLSIGYCRECRIAFVIKQAEQIPIIVQDPWLGPRRVENVGENEYL